MRAGEAPPKTWAEEVRRLGKGAAKGGRAAWTAGRRFTSAWTERTQLATYAYRRSIGDSPARAAAITFATVLDYGDRSTTLNVLRWFLPFATWMWKAPRLAGEAVVSRPATALAPLRFAQGLQSTAERQSGEPAFESRQYIRELSPAFRLPEQMRQMVSDATETFGGRPSAPGAQIHAQPRELITEATQPIMEAARGNFRPLGMGAGPFSRLVIESIAEKGLQEHKDLAAPSLGKPFPPNVPGIHELEQALGIDISAASGQNPWGARYFAPWMMPAPMTTGINALINRTQGEYTAPIATLGSYRPYAEDPRTLIARQVLGTIFGHRTYDVTKEAALWNALDDPAVREALAEQRAVWQLLLRASERMARDRMIEKQKGPPLPAPLVP